MNWQKLINSILIVGLITYLFGYLGSYHWIFDGFSHFRIYHLLFFIVVIVCFLLKKRYAISFFFGIFVVIILAEIAPFYKPVKSNKIEGTLKIGSINLLSSNAEYDKFKNFILEENFDVFLAMEVTPDWKKNIVFLDKAYPFKKIIPRDDNFGIGVFSKQPFLEVKEISLNEIGLPSILATFEYKSDTITLLGTHPLPAAGSFRFKSRNAQFENINKLVKEIDSYAIVMGDFNCTTYSSKMTSIIKNTDLKDTRYGFGLQNTWYAGNPFISIPIDHCFVTDDFEVQDRRIGKDIGSDHFPVIIELTKRTDN